MPGTFSVCFFLSSRAASLKNEFSNATQRKKNLFENENEKAAMKWLAFKLVELIARCQL